MGREIPGFNGYLEEFGSSPSRSALPLAGEIARANHADVSPTNSMPTCIPRILLPLAALALLPGCGAEKDEKARAAIHAAGYAYSVDDFVRAAGEGKADVLTQYLKAGMNPDAADEKGQTALLAASTSGHGHIVQLLRDAGALAAASSATGQAALMEAARSGNEQAVKVLLAAGANAEARDDTGMTPLMAAVVAGRTVVVALLVQSALGSLDPALQLAAMEGHTSVMAVLMDKGASPHATSVDGRTPMMFAAQYGHTEAARLLRQRGASVTALDENLKSPADHAEENGHEDIAAYLRGPDRTADGAADGPAAPRLPDMTWPGDPPADLGAVAASMVMVDYRTRRLPIVVEEVTELNARIRLLTGGGETLTLAPGEEIPGTGLTVESLRRRFTAAKSGEGRLLDVSEVRVVESATGRRYLAVRGLPALTGEGCALLKFAGSDSLIEARRGDVCQAGTLEVEVTDVRPGQIVLERRDNKETVTVLQSGR